MDMAAPLPKRELPTTSAGAASPEVEPAIDKEFATMVCCCWSVVACVHVARPKEGCDGGSAGWGCDGVVLERGRRDEICSRKRRPKARAFPH